MKHNIKHEIGCLATCTLHYVIKMYIFYVHSVHVRVYGDYMCVCIYAFNDYMCVCVCLLFTL